MSYDPASPGTSPGPLASNDRESATDAGTDAVQPVDGGPPAAEPSFAEPSLQPSASPVAEAASAPPAPSFAEPSLVASPVDELAPAATTPEPAAPVYEPYPALDHVFEDPFGDVPVSLELAYTTSDLGLSADAFDRAIPYEGVARRRSSAGSRIRKVGRELAEHGQDDRLRQ
ncbi:MAG: hypothetical protein EPO22_02445, partial [Dehalococcoidia bacterium]